MKIVNERKKTTKRNKKGRTNDYGWMTEKKTGGKEREWEGRGEEEKEEKSNE